MFERVANDFATNPELVGKGGINWFDFEMNRLVFLLRLDVGVEGFEVFFVGLKSVLTVFSEIRAT